MTDFLDIVGGELFALLAGFALVLGVAYVILILCREILGILGGFAVVVVYAALIFEEMISIRRGRK